MVWDLTPIQGNETSFLDLVIFANDAVNGLHVGLFLIALFIIQAAALSKFELGFEGTVTLSAWMCFIYSIFFTLAGMLNFYFLIGFLTISGFGTLYLYLRNK